MAYDGLEVLIKVLEKDGGLVKHLVENTLFFQPDCVKRQAAEMLELAKTDKLPVRFSTAESIYMTSDGTIHKRLYANKIEASAKTDREDIYTTVRPNIRITVDSTGNRYVCQAIKRYTGEWVSSGTKISTIKNYMISHIWGKTNDPLCFTALWNLALIPMHCSFILDKPMAQHKQVHDVIELYKAICWMLYRPDKLTNNQVSPDIPEHEYLDKARYYIDNGLLRLLPKIKNE